MRTPYRVNGNEELKSKDFNTLISYKHLSDSELYNHSKDIILAKATTIEEIGLFNELVNRDFFNLSIFVGFMPSNIDNTAGYTISMSKIEHDNKMWNENVPITIPFELKEPMNIALGYESKFIDTIAERMSERMRGSTSETGISVEFLPVPDSYLSAMNDYVNDKKDMLLSLISIGDIVECITNANNYYEKEKENILKYLHDGKYKEDERYKDIDSAYPERLLLSLIDRVKVNYLIVEKLIKNIQ